MSDLLGSLRRRVPANAERVVETCTTELAEYAAAARDPREHADMLDFAVFIRRRTIDLVAADEPLTEDDLAVVAATGERRGETGMSRTSLRRLLTLHAGATLTEIQEASGPHDLAMTMRMLGWLGQQGAAAQQAYTSGFLKGQKYFLPLMAQVRQFAEMLLADEAAALANGGNLGIQVPGSYRVIVVRTSDVAAELFTEAVHVVWRRYRAPATWHGLGEFVALLPAEQDTTATRLISDLTEIIGDPFSVGTASGLATALAEAFALARRVSRVTRPETAPGHLHTAADVFIELGAADLPEIDRWLHHLAQRLAAGPGLVETLDAYYRQDLNRPRAAAALRIHPRSLDYRLRRARELTGIDPTGTQGIRILGTVVSRVLANG